jgi:hypothetical protein
MSKNNFDIRGLLDIVRDRPLMYLPCKSIVHLDTFISGAYLAQRMIEGDDIGFEPDELTAFNNKVIEKYSVETKHSWSSIILFYSGSEEKAFDNFFELWDELM